MAEVCLASTNGTCTCTGDLPELPKDPRPWMCPSTTTTELPTTNELPTTPNMTGSTTTIMTSVASGMPTDDDNNELIVWLSVGCTFLVIAIVLTAVPLVLRHRKKRKSEQDDKEGLPVNDGDETDGKPTGQGKDNVVTKDGSTAQNGTEVKQHEPKKIDVKPDQGGTATSPKPTDGAGSDSNQGHGEVQTTSL